MRNLVLALLLAVGLPSAAIAHGPEGHGETSEPAGSGSLSEYPAVDTAEVKAEPPFQDTEVEIKDPEVGFGTVLRALHPATVHFPIALFLFAATIEFFGAASKRSHFATVDILIVGGAVSAVVAALFGWIHTGLWFGGGLSMQWHRWTGTGIAVAGLILLLLTRRTNRFALRVLLGLVCIALLMQGYWGGELAHGPGHLTSSR